MRSPRTPEEFMKLGYKPVRKGLRTQDEVYKLFRPSKTPEISVTKMSEEPLERVSFKGKKPFTDHAEIMSAYLNQFLELATRLDAPTLDCEKLKKRKAKWEAENI